MVKRYVPYVVLYALGVVSAWGLFQITKSPGGATEVASAAPKMARSTIRSARSHRPVAALPRVGGKDDAADQHRDADSDPEAGSEHAALRTPTRKPISSPESASTAKLRAAVAKGDPRAVTQLLETRNHDVNAVDKSGRSLLMTAVENGHSDVARELIKAGADVDRRSRDGETPLMVAARGGDPVIVHLLLEGGADIDVRNRNGLTAQTLAKNSGHEVVYEFISDEVRRRGKERNMIAKAQDLLNKLGYKLGTADGIAGPKTSRAVRRFQKGHRIRVDGKITPALLSALQRKLARRATSQSLASREAAPTKSTAGVEKVESQAADNSGDKSWFDRTASSFSGLLKSSKESWNSTARLCESARDRWVQNADGDWIECTNVPNY